MLLSRRNFSPLSFQIFCLISTGLVFLFSSCSQTINPVDSRASEPRMNLELIENTCTDAFVKLHLENHSLPEQMEFTRDISNTKSFTLFSADTILYVDSLKPRQSYALAARSRDKQIVTDGTKLTVSALDTTSFSFDTRFFTFGNIDDYLNDVVVLNYNDIWAVGKITVFDSITSTTASYNATHFDGSSWKMHKLYFPNSETDRTPVVASADAIIAPSPDSILIFAGNRMTRFNGTSQYDTAITISSVKKLFARHSNDIYGVGDGGKIIHFNGKTWQFMESGTTYNMTDIWGVPNSPVLWACGGNADNSGSFLLRYDGAKWDMLLGVGPDAWSVWSNSPNQVYYASYHFMEYNNRSNTPDIFHDIKQNKYTGSCIRGTACNDIFVSRGYAISHFNGMTYQDIFESPYYGTFLYFKTMDIKQHSACLVGGKSQFFSLHSSWINTNAFAAIIRY